MKKIIVYMFIIVIILNVAGCGNQRKEQRTSLEDISWEEIVQDVKGTTVNFYGWGGDQRVNRWIDETVAPQLKEKYNIKLNRVGMDIGDILNKLLGEKQANKNKGTIDVVWINGENFYTAKTNDLLYGPFTHKMPNFIQYVDEEDHDVQYDFGYPVDGYEAPFGKAQLVFTYDTARLTSPPKNHEELLQLAKQYPGKITYPAPPDFTGSAFIRNIIYDIVGFENFKEIKADDQELEVAVGPAMEFFNQIKPYLWMGGESYPATVAQLDNMFADGEILMTMSYTPFLTAGKIETGDFPSTSETFVFDNGNIGNTHFLAIPFNATNKEGAVMLINEILSVELQASKYDPKNWGDLPVLDNDKLSEEEKNIFDSIGLGKGALPQDVLLNNRLSEMPADVIPMLDEIWLRNILKTGE